MFDFKKGLEEYSDSDINTGLKRYAYERATYQGNCKIKLFALNWRNVKKMNVKSMKKVWKVKLKYTSLL